MNVAKGGSLRRLINEQFDQSNYYVSRVRFLEGIVNVWDVDNGKDSFKDENETKKCFLQRPHLEFGDGGAVVVCFFKQDLIGQITEEHDYRSFSIMSALASRYVVCSIFMMDSLSE